MKQRQRALRTVTAVVLALLLSLTATYRLARARTVQSFGRLVARAETSERVVALTFDDGPVAAHLDEVLGALRSGRVRATFFVTGGDLEAAPEAGRRLVADGHQLGNHSYSHARMVFRSQGFIRDEVERTDRLIREAGERGEIPFRPPYCWKLLGLPWFLWRSGRTSVTWDVEPDSHPEVASSPRRIADHVKQRVRPGSIVLLHVWWSGREASRAAIPLIVDSLRAEGYRFVTVSELLPLTGP